MSAGAGRGGATSGTLGGMTAADLPAVPPSPEVVELLGRVLRDLEPRTEDLVGEIAARIVARVPALDGDDRLLAAIERTSRANMRTLYELLTEPDLSLEAPAAAVALAAALVQAEQPLSALIESYHVGQALFLDTWLESLAGATDDAQLLSAATVGSYRRMCAYLDAVLARIVEQYLEERRQWQARRVRRQWQVVRGLLDGSSAETEAGASVVLGYDLSLVHVGAVLTETGGTARDRGDEVGLGSESLAEVARSLAQRLGAGRALTLPAGPGLLYAWVAVPSAGAAADLAGLEVPAGVRVAVGAPQRGVEGFRASHEQAQWASQLLRGATELPAVVAYEDVAALCLLRDDPRHVRAFVAQQLGGLCRRDEETRALRETVHVALEEGLNASSAGRRLTVHKNTVLYRLRGAEALRGRPLTDGRLELELALRIVAAQGEDVLGPAPGPR